MLKHTVSEIISTRLSKDLRKEKLSRQTWFASSASSVKSLIPLTKPTISLLVVVTCLPAIFMAASGTWDPVKTFLILFATWLASAGAAVFNHVLDADIDQTMKRTRARPIPTGKASAWEAIIFGLVLTVVSSLLLLRASVSSLAMWVALGGNAFYVLVYTWFLKRRTTQNIVIGGAAGAVGPLIGWAAVSGQLPLVPWLLFLYIFLWTPPHFWALAIKYRDDYAKVGIPMYPVVHGVKKTCWQILIYSIALVPMGFALYFTGAAGMFFLVASTGLSLYFVLLAVKLVLSEDPSKSAMKVFHYSCVYLLAVFIALTIEQLAMAG